MQYPIDQDDIDFLKSKYEMTDEEIYETKILYRRGNCSICKSAKIVRSRRKENSREDS